MNIRDFYEKVKSACYSTSYNEERGSAVFSILKDFEKHLDDSSNCSNCGEAVFIWGDDLMQYEVCRKCGKVRK